MDLGQDLGLLTLFVDPQLAVVADGDFGFLFFGDQLEFFFG